MIHPDTELQFINDEIGHGVFAKKEIKKGTITWAMDSLDREFTPAQIELMDEVYREIIMTYTFRNRKGNHIFCWDHGRYVNHSFKPNCIATAYNFEIAVRDIKAGEQLTNDYGFLNIIESFRPFPEKSKRKVVHPNDLVNYAHEWDKLIKPAFLKITKTDQALKKVIRTELWSKIERIIVGQEDIESISKNYYNPLL